MEFNGCQKLASNSEPVDLAFEYKRPPGDTEGKAPVIFLHGITASKKCWRDIPQFVANETKREVYVVDFRHHGDSPWSESFEFESNELDLHHFMDTHKIDKAILVGHSMGGMVAMKYALAVPHKIEKLIIEDATLGRIPEEVILFLVSKLAIAKACINEIPTELDDAAAHKLLPKIILEKLPKVFREFAQFDENSFLLKKENGKFSFKLNIDAILSALRNLPRVQPEGSYDGPACFIYGKKSPFNVESDKDMIKRHFPHAELFGVENAGHTVHEDCSLEFQAILLNFLLDK